MRITLLIVILFPLVPAYSQWQTIHPQGELNRFIAHGRISGDGSQWVAFGNDLAVSENAGETWTVESVNLPFVFKPDLRNFDIVFVNDDTGFIAYQQFIYKTEDGGRTWTSVVSLQPSNNKYPYSAYFRSIAFVDEEEGYAVGDFKKIFHTTDGGDHWEQVSWTGETAPFIAYTDVSIGKNKELRIGGYEVSDILMNFGFDEFVMTSEDAGQNWERTSLPTGADFREAEVHVTGDSEYFVHLSRTQSTEELFFTADDGLHWEERTPAEMRSVRVLECLPDGAILAWGEDFTYRSTMYRSSNYGQSWHEISLPVFAQQDDHVITDIVFQDNINGFAVGAGGNILTTADGGQSWAVSNRGFPLFYSFDMINEELGFASTGVGLFITEDGGSSWEFMTESDSLTIMDMAFESPDNGLFFGWRNFYHHVSDGGNVVEPITLPLNFVSLSAAVQKGDSLFVSGAVLGPSRNVFMKSGDRGATWAVQDLPAVDGFVTQMKRAGNHLYYAASGGLLRSTAKGENWETLSEFEQDYLHAFLTIDEQTFLGYFGSGQVKRTVNAGHDWQTVGDFSNAMLKDFIRIGSLIFAYGSEVRDGASFGMIWRSSDLGVTWQKEVLPLCDNLINDMDVIGETAYAIGGYGRIFKIDLSEVVTGVEGDGGKVSVKTYPVPAGHELFIESHLNLDNTYTLIDVTGKAKGLLADRIGDHRWRIDLTTVLPGVYVLQGDTPNGEFRKRIVVTGM